MSEVDCDTSMVNIVISVGRSKLDFRLADQRDHPARSGSSGGAERPPADAAPGTGVA